MKKMFLFLIVVAVSVISAKGNDKVYTSFDESTGTLTYYYDDQMYSRAQTEVYDPKSKPDAVRFIGYNDKVQKAVIDVSMKSADLSSCRSMFYGRVDEGYTDRALSSLTTIEGWCNLNTAAVKDMSDMFNGCESLKELDLHSFNTANVTTMNNMFHGCLSLEEVNLSSFNTANVTDMGSMFYYCEKLTSLNINHFDMSYVTSASYMFAYCSALTTIYCNNDWSTYAQMTISSAMFDGCNALKGGKGTTPSDVSKKDKTYALPDGLDGKQGLFTSVKEVYTEFVKASGTLTYYYDEKRSTRLGITERYDPIANPEALRFKGYNEYVKKAVIDASMADAGLTSMRFMFCGKNDDEYGGWCYLREMTSIEGLEHLNTDKVTDMSNMFNGCEALTSLNLSPFNTERVTDMSSMFGSCEALTALDLSNFITTNVENMSKMFYYCEALNSLNLSKFNTDNVTDMSNMFNGCEALTSLNLSKFNTEKVTNMSGIFKGCNHLTALDLSNFTTEKVTTMVAMFEDCRALESLNISSFNTANVEQMHYLFIGCQSLKSLDLRHFITDKVTSMEEMFYGCDALTSLDLSSFNTANVTSMRRMFTSCGALTELDLSNFNTDNVTDMTGMFSYCLALESLNIRSFNTANVTTMEDMFMFCTALKSLDLSKFNTAKVTKTENMFLNCKVLETLDLSNFDTGNVTNMTGMFSHCEALKTIDLTPLNSINVTNMDGLFQGCTSLTSVDLSKLNTSKVKNMTNMFRECPSLKELNLSRFNISQVTYMVYMFEDCEALTTIYCNEDWNTIGSAASTDMFKGCINIVGGNGTIYDSGKTDCEYARPDGVDGKKGYFTKLITFSVRFEDWDGTLLKKEDVLIGKSATAPEDPKRPGYKFTGWSEDFTHVTKDLVVTALYERIDEAIEKAESQESNIESQKVLRDGQILIIREGKPYNVQGVVVE